MNLDFTWVTSDQQLADALTIVKRFSAVAVDTEFRRRDTFYPQIALVQLAVDGHCWLIDPLTLEDASPLADLLTNRDIIKVLHSASEDLEVFERWLGVLPRPLFDTQKAAAMLNMGFGLSYRALIQLMLDIEVSKDETQSDWLARPLSDAQCDYAVQDVVFLNRCWPTLANKARDKAVFGWVLEEGDATETGGRGPLAKFKSAWKLRPEGLAVLMALVDWREAEARRRDKPRSWILADKVINDLVSKLPENMPQLANISGIPQSVLRRDGKQLINVIASARENASHQPPSRLAGPACSAVRALAKALGPEIEGIAGNLEMNVEILMPNRELELIAREASGETVEEPPHWSGWRRAVVVEPLRTRARELNQG